MANNDQPEKMSRREFLVDAVKASAVAGLTLGAGKAMLKISNTPRDANIPTVPPFTAPDTEGVFSVARGQNPYSIVRKAIEDAGAINRFVKPGEKVLIKVNCAFARPAWMGATSSPEVVGEVVKLCYEAGASEVRAADNPINDAKGCFLKSGIGKAVQDAGGKIWMPKPSDFANVKVSSGVIGTWEVFYKPLQWADRVIGIPTVKTHNLCGASMTMKNWYGFMGGSRSRFHQDIHNVIAELCQFITPSLIVLDGTRMLVSNGPTGGSADDVKIANTVVASTDPVAVDAFAAQMLGLKRDDVPYIALAESRGLGTTRYTSLPSYTEAQL